MRIVQVANYVTERSGGLRRSMLELSRRYVEAGHRCAMVIPSNATTLRRQADSGVEVITLPGVTVPSSGGYRSIIRRKPLQHLLTGLGPDLVELSDKTTLSWVPGWLGRRGIPTVLLVHERHDIVLADSLPPWLPWRGVIDGWTARAALASAAVVCASAYSAAQFDGVAGITPVRIPLGVDTDTFAPFAPSDSGPVAAGSAGKDSAATASSPHHLVYLGRLSPEKHVEVIFDAVAELGRRGVDVHLDVVGDGPLRAPFERLCRRLPVTFHGVLHDRAEIAAILRSARVAISPGPAETFGLAVLEALACGTPVVAVDRGAAPEMLRADGSVGVAVEPDGWSMADGIEHVIAGERAAQRQACRAHAEQFTWDRTAAAMLSLFDQHAAGSDRNRYALHA